jgi:hypothetical protein
MINSISVLYNNKLNPMKQTIYCSFTTTFSIPIRKVLGQNELKTVGRSPLDLVTGFGGKRQDSGFQL